MKNLRSLLLTVCLIAALSPIVFAQNGNGNFLLTDNGANNPANSSYKDAPILKTAGSYYPTPPFASRLRKLGEDGSISKPIPFASGILTNGDFSTDANHKPMPYAYWFREQKGSLNFDLGTEYHVSKVRVCILNSGKAHGTAKIGIYTHEELLEAGQQPMQEIKAANGWNEFAINKDTDQIKLDFTRAENAQFITVTEVEIWGKKNENSRPIPAALPEKVLSGNQIGFDFGPASAPAFLNFKTVDSKTLYTKERGYGWIPYVNGQRSPNSKLTFPPGLREGDRGVGERGGRWISSIPKDDLYRDFVSTSRFYTRQTTQEFDVDIPNGKYLVYLASGDLIYGHPGKSTFDVDAEGKRVVDSLTYDNIFRAHASFNVEVKDGQLNLVFSDDSPSFQAGWTLDGLLILPVNNTGEIESAKNTWKEVERVVKAQQDSTIIPKRTFFDYAEKNKLFPLSQQQTDQGYLLFVRDWMRMVYPNTIPLQREVQDAKVEVAAAPSQYTTATVGVYPLKSTFKATVEVSDLLNEKQQKVDKSNIEIRVTGYMPEHMKIEPRIAGDYTYYVSDSSQGPTIMRQVPKILWPYKKSIEVKETTQLWLTFHVPEGTKPGQYRGILTFKPENRAEQKIPISLTVYPFTLLQSDRIQGVYWLADDYNHLDAELKDMADHGIRAVTLSNQVPAELRREGDKAVVDFSRLDLLVKKIKDAGLMGYIPFATGSTRIIINDFLKANPDINAKMSLDPAYEFVVSQLYEYSKKNNWPEILFYPVDEIGSSQQSRSSLKYLSGLIRHAAPKAEIYTTVNNFSAGMECINYFDYATTNIPLTKEQEQTFLSHGKKLMRYGNGYNFNPRISRTLSGYGFWQRPALAMYYYHYRYTVGDPMNPLDGTSRDFMLAYPSPDGPIDSIDLEAIREGNNDLRYIKTMQVWMDKAKQAGKASAIVQKGEAILAEITNCNPAYDQYDFAGVPNEKYAEWRRGMAQVIIQLQDSLR